MIDLTLLLLKVREVTAGFH